MSGYAEARPGQIHATLSLLQHFRAFLASPCQEMRDPYELPAWGDLADRLDKPAAQRRLTWLIQVAINRKAGQDGSRGRFDTEDSWRHLVLLAHRLNTPRVIVRVPELGEWKSYLLARCPERFLTPEEE